jgi:hypothetical protein
MEFASPNILSTPTYVLLVALIVTGVACEGDTVISPYSGRDIYFSVYGFVSASDTHYVRVVPIRSNGSRDKTPKDLDVHVSTLELTTGRIDEWAPVLNQLNDGSRGLAFSDSTFGHVFRAIFTPNAEDQFRLDVTRFDGKKSSANATIPQVAPPIDNGYVDLAGEVHQRILWPGVFHQPFRVISLYVVTSTDLNPTTFGIPLYHNSTGTVSEAGLEIDVNLNYDVRAIRRHIVDNLNRFTSTPTLENPSNFNLNLVERRMRLFVGDSTWNFISFDVGDASLAQPGAFSNIENGLGFFGGLGTNFGNFPITDAARRLQIGLSS